MKPKNKKLVCGVGVNDSDYVAEKRETIGYIDGKQKRKQVWICPCYRAWRDMLKRCYSTKFQERQPTYRGCTVLKEWHTFSNFKSWMETQEFGRGWSLIRTLLFVGNKGCTALTHAFLLRNWLTRLPMIAEWRGVSGYLVGCIGTKLRVNFNPGAVTHLPIKEKGGLGLLHL